MIKITGLWENQKKDGTTYLSGYMGGAKVLIFPNSYKTEGSNQPDFQMFLAENERRENKGGDPFKGEGKEISLDDKDLPF